MYLTNSTKESTMSKQVTIRSSTGGTITYTKTGLIHRTSSGAYSGKIAALEKAPAK
tara:strand:+ start:4284 stop:4451 length:168 start_codon:yes stop_codon:yes gene_type:complete